LSTQEIVRAWTDEEYRDSLGEQELAGIPESPVGVVELRDSELTFGDAIGAATYYCTYPATRPC
jgi:mersacidin/lichenicidin family type 2 lantibiotic